MGEFHQLNLLNVKCYETCATNCQTNKQINNSIKINAIAVAVVKTTKRLTLT